MDPQYMPTWPVVIGLFLNGLLSAYLAHKQKKNIYLWFSIGFGFGLLGIMALFFLHQQKKPIRKKGTNPIPLASIEGPKDKLWYYLDPTHNRKGPMSLEALTSEWRQGKVFSSTYVWNEELSDWKLLENFLAKK
jgi:hypothetical protein